MSQSSKLLWGEGQFLSPQHFQRQDAYHEARLHEVSRVLHPFLWGLRSVRFDLSSLASGILRPVEVSVIFPDGELYSAPDKDELPAPLTLENLPEGTQATTVYLALPLLKEHGHNCVTDPTDTAARYLIDSSPTADTFSDAADADVSFLYKAVRLITDQQPRDAYVSVPLARLRRTSTGGFELEQDFIPPLVNLSASGQLLSQLRALLDALQARADALYAMFRKPSENIVEFRSGDMASFWLLHSVNSAFATLKHFYQHPELAPERLYIELSRIAGALLSFSTDYQLDDLPAYQHEQPATAFNKLFDIIRAQINTVFSANHIAIALTEVKPSYHSGSLDAQSLRGNVAFYLAVKADLPAAELIDKIPPRLKIGAPEDVGNIVLSALPGIRLSHEPQVPAAIPVRAGSSYFSLEAKGKLYERMLEAGAVMIYAPVGIPGLQIELMAVTS